MSKTNNNAVWNAITKDDYNDYLSAISDADINEEIDSANLLEIAISYGANDIALNLISRGIDINHRGKNGMTPLHVCAWYYNQYDCIELAKSLVSLSKNIDVTDDYGNTPLWYATHFSSLLKYKDNPSRYDLVKLLVSKGADPLHPNKVNRSPYDFATIHEDPILLRLLGIDCKTEE